MNKITMTVLLLLIFGSILTACSVDDKIDTAINGKPMKQSPSDKPSKAVLEADIEKTFTALQAEIGVALCNNDKQCGAIPIGHRPCGGPERYLAYSSANTDTTRLIELSNNHQKLSNQLNVLLGLNSICSIVPEPKVICATADGQSICQIAETNDIPIM